MSAALAVPERPDLRAVPKPCPPAYNTGKRPADGPKPATRGGHACRWIEANIILPSGQWRGEPMRLMWWQKLFIYLLFEIAAGSDLRRFKRVLLLIPKKNAKSTTLAALALYLLDGDPTETNPVIACGANSAEQANLVFGAAKEMVKLSPTLAERLVCYARTIQRRDNPEAKIVKVSRAIATNDGLFLTAVILDEVHEFVDEADEAFYTVMTNATIAARQPLILLLTTAGADLDTLCGRLYEHGKRVASGEVEDPEFLFLCWEAPEAAPHDDPATWASCNPSYGVILNDSGYRAKLNDPALTLAAFCRYFLNRWTGVVEFWLPLGAWEKCADPSIGLEPGLPTFIGIDAATKYDSTALVITQKREDGKKVQRCRIWERPTIATTAKPDPTWRLPLGEVADALRSLAKQYRVLAIGCDPSFMWHELLALQEEGLPVEEISQGNARMVPAATRFYGGVVGEQVIHDGDPAFTRQIKNAVAKEVEGGGWRLAKGKARRKMDAAIAAAQSYWLATRDDEPAEAAPGVFFLDAAGGG